MWEWNPHEEPTHTSLLVFPGRRSTSKGFSCPTHPKHHFLWSNNHGKVQPAPPHGRISALLPPLISALDSLCSPLQTSSALLPRVLPQELLKKGKTKAFLWSWSSAFSSPPLSCFWWYDAFEPAYIATWKHCLIGQTTDVLKHQDEGAEETEVLSPDIKSRPPKFQGYLNQKMTQTQSLCTIIISQ